MFKAWFLSSAGALGQAPHLSEPRFPDSYNGYVEYFRSACTTELSRGFDKMCDALAHHLTGTAHSINTSCRHHDHCSRSQYWAQIPGAGREQCVCVLWPIRHPLTAGLDDRSEVWILLVPVSPCGHCSVGALDRCESSEWMI